MANILSDIEKMSQILGKENIDCLTNLFEEMNGQPPCVNKKRYRANHPAQIDVLNYLENSAHLIRVETIKTEQFYHLRPYALPLIKTPKVQNLLILMCEIYQKFSAFYKERLDAAITREELLKAVDAPTENILEALSYFRDSGILGGCGNEFPYKENSQINLLESVILKKDFLEVLTDYYRWNFIGKKEEEFLFTDNKKEIFPQGIKIEDKKIGRPGLKNQIIGAYEFLQKEKIIDYSKTLKAHEEAILEAVQKLFYKEEKIEGISYKTISKYLGKRFKYDKNL